MRGHETPIRTSPSSEKAARWELPLWYRQWAEFPSGPPRTSDTQAVLSGEALGRPVLIQAEMVRPQASLVARQAMHAADQLLVAIALNDVAACEHPPLRGDHDLERHLGHLSEQPSVVDETRDIRGDEPVQHAADPNDLPRKNTGINGGFRVIPHDTPQKLHARGNLAAIVFHTDLAIGIFQITVAGPRAQIDPTAQNAVSEEAMVLFIGVGLDYGGFDFPADFRGVGNTGRRLDRGVLDHTSACSDVHRALQERVGRDTDAIFQYNRSVVCVRGHVLPNFHLFRREYPVGDLPV